MPEKKDGTGSFKAGAGRHSAREILSQPHCWSECLKELERPGYLDEIWKPFAELNEWLFVGCGSSYYVALAAAAAWSAITGQRARAIPASEMLLFPDLVMNGAEQMGGVVISRSGKTSEAVQAAEALEQRGVRTLAVSCAAGQPLERAATGTLLLSPADEESTVMTRSFTSMLLALEYLARCVAPENSVNAGLRQLPRAAEGVLKNIEAAIKEFVRTRQFADYICLGQGPFYGLACESALKITEMSVSYAQSFHTLEFRHGPKSVVGPETLILFLLSETGYEAECSVLEEIKSLGGTTLAICNRADERAASASDLLVELQMEFPELARLAPYVFAGQLLGLYTGLKKGLDPDKPRHLSRVVTLKQDAERSQAAR